MPATRSRSPFFLFNVLNSRSELKRDEVSTVGKVLCGGICLLLLMDIAVVVFFVQTNARIEALRHDNFTQVVLQGMEQSGAKHGEFSSAARTTIKNHNVNIKLYMDQANAEDAEIDAIDPSAVKVTGVDKLVVALKKLEQSEAPSAYEVEQVDKLAENAQKQIEQIEKQLTAISNYGATRSHIEQELQPVLNGIKSSLDNFEFQLNNLAEEQNRNQMDLYNHMNATLESFNHVYNFIHKGDEFRLLNNLYNVEFASFDKDYIPFATEFDKKYFGTKLSLENSFDLKLPRVYACTIEARVKSLQPFNIAFQYVDHALSTEVDLDGAPIDESEVLFEVKKVRGNYKNSATLNEMKVFTLAPGKHSLYVRAVSEGAASKVHMTGLKMSCLSYRNFQSVPNVE